MAIVQVQSLLRSITRDEALSDLTTLAESMKLRASSWRIGSTARFFIMALSETAARWSVHVALIAASGYNSTSFGNALAKFSKSRFDNPKIRAVKTLGKIRLTDDSGDGPHTILTGERVFSFEDDPTITYRNTEGGTIPQSGSVDLVIEAEVGGDAHNVAVDTITKMAPVIAGVSVTNPANPTDWITRTGVNAEADTDLQARNPSKWDTLGGAAPKGAYEHWAKTANTEIDDSGDPVGIAKVSVDDDNPDGPGSVDVYIANDSGTATAAQVTDVKEYLIARKPRTDKVRALAAIPRPVTVTGTFRVPAGLTADRKTKIEQAVTDYINSLPIGGSDIGESLGVVVVSEIIEAAMGVDDVKRVELSTPTADIQLQANEIATVAAVTFTGTEI
jgi:phage-related baseplate assembly protein